VRLDNVTLCTPPYSATLIEHLDLTVNRGERLLVVGPSGCGKTSLLRAIGRLWTAGAGEIATPPVAQVVVCVKSVLLTTCLHASQVAGL
jgi:vitamin B12/bleomycin/antimicrobial peptide transport system ATP-binding/permease protein